MIKKEVIAGSNKIVVGEKYNDLILRTLGKIYILTGSKLTLLQNLVETVNKADSGNVIFTTNIDTLSYPGEGFFVYDTVNKVLYVSYAQSYLPLMGEGEFNIPGLSKHFVKKTGDVMTGSLDINNGIVTITQTDQAPFHINSKKLVRNLNVEYFNGLTYDKYAKIEEDETIFGKWKFGNTTSFLKRTVFHDQLISGGGFAPGFAGYGWRLDTATNTLEIDNLIVRKVLRVFELVVSKIRATEGSLWVSSANEIYKVTIPENEVTFDFEFFLFQTGVEGNEPQLLTYVLKESLVNPDITDPSNYDIKDIKLYTDFFKSGKFFKIELEQGKLPPFKIYDILRCQRFTGKDIRYYDAIVTLVANTYYIIEVSDYYNNLYNSGTINPEEPLNLVSRSPYNEITSTPVEKDVLVRMGNILEPGRQGAIYLNAEEEASPTIDILSDMNRPNWSVPLMLAPGKYFNSLKLRLGNLNGIYDPVFRSNQPRGYGFYGQNVFIKGRFVQVEADGSESEMTIYRGDWSYKGTYYYNNLVTYNGSMYMCLVQSVGPFPTEENNPAIDIKSWKLIIQKGENGKDAPEVLMKYSEVNKPYTGSGEDTDIWHSVITSTDLYAIISTDEWKTHTGPYKIIGEDGNSPHFYFTLAGFVDVPPFNATNDPSLELSSDWVDGPPVEVPTDQFVWMTVRLFKEGSFAPGSKWTVPTRLTGDKGNKGEDGKSYEYCYVVGPPDTFIPKVVHKPGDDTTVDEYLPYVDSNYVLKWSDDPVGTDHINKYEYVIQRKKVNGIWGEFSIPAVWATFGKDGHDGKDYEWIFNNTNSSTAPTPPEFSATGDYQNDDYTGPASNGWTDDAATPTEQLLYVWSSKRKKVNGLWERFSTPVVWSRYSKDGIDGLPGGDGPSILFYGEYSASESYMISSSIRLVVAITEGDLKTYYQTKLPKEGAPEGAFINIPPTNTTYWKPFGGNFKSLATEVLFAEYANIGQLIFKNQRLISQSGTVDGSASKNFKDPNFVPNLTIDGNTGFIDMIMGTFGKLLDGSGFFVEGTNIYGKSLVNGKLVNRILITTDKLPTLESLLLDVGNAYEPCPAVKCYGLGTDINTGKLEEPYAPPGIGDCWDPTIKRAVSVRRATNPFTDTNTRNQDKLSQEFTIQESPLGYTSRLLHITINGKTPQFGVLATGTHLAIIYLQKKVNTSWVNYKLLDEGDNYVTVAVGDTFRINSTLKQTIKSDVFGIYLFNDGSGGSGPMTKSIENEIIESYPDLNNTSWIHKQGATASGLDSLLLSEYPNWPTVYDNVNITVSGTCFQPIYINLPHLYVYSTVFDAVSKTIIANDGFCSYWGPENYFYFSKDSGLLHKSALSETSTASLLVTNSNNLEERIYKLEQKLGMV